MSCSIQMLAATACLGLASGTVLADDYDFADVVHVEPLRSQVRISEPVRKCWQETSHVSEGPFSYNHVGGTLIGSAIGHNVSVDRRRQLYGNPGRSYERPGDRIRVRVDVTPAGG